jgi:hypothetical protein
MLYSREGKICLSLRESRVESETVTESTLALTAAFASKPQQKKSAWNFSRKSPALNANRALIEP